MSMIERIKQKARSSVKTIVFPEGDEPRTVAAASQILREGIAKPVLLGGCTWLALALSTLFYVLVLQP